MSPQDDVRNDPRSALKSDNPGVRKHAVAVLAYSPDADAGVLLRSALHDTDSSVRRLAAFALCVRARRQGETEAVEPLAAALSDVAPEVRLMAAKCLGQLGDARAREPLLDALTDPDVDVQRAANTALIHVGDPEPERRLAIAISSEDLDLRFSAGLDLANRHDRRALAPLVAVLTQNWSGTQDRRDARLSAIDGLGKLQDPAAAPALLDALGDDDFEVRVAANHALMAVGDPNPFERLLRVIRSRDLDWGRTARRYKVVARELWARDRELRREAVGALGRSGDPRAVPVLLEFVQSSSLEEVREAASQVLVGLGDPQPYERLSALIRGPHDTLSATACEELVSRGERRAIEVLMDALRDSGHHQPNAARALMKLGNAPRLEPLTMLLARGDQEEGARAAKELGVLGDARALAALLHRLSDTQESQRVRWAANQAILDLGDPDPAQRLSALRAGDEPLLDAARDLEVPDDGPRLEWLMELLAHESKWIRERAAEALGALGDAAATDALLDVLSDSREDDSVRQAVNQALLDLGDTKPERRLSALREIEWAAAVKALRLWEDAGELRCLKAIEMFAALGDRNAVPVLERVMKGPPNDRIACAVSSALGQLGDASAIHTLMREIVDEAVSGGRQEVAERAIREIVRHEPEDGLRALLEELDSGRGWQIAAARLLGELGDESVVADLRSLGEDDDGDVRAAAQEALRTLARRGVRE